MTTLDDLVALAQTSDQDSLDTKQLANLAEQFESATPYGTRHNAKLDLIERLTGARLGLRGTGSCITIVQNYVYLIDLGIKDIGKFVERCPQVFGYDVAGNMRPMVGYLRGLGIKDIGKLVERFPRVFGLNIAGNIQPKVDYLTSLGVKDIGKLVERFPQVFGYNVAGNIQPKVEYLRGLGIKDIGRLVERFPQVLNLNIAGNIQPKVEYLQGLGIKDIGKLVKRFPHVFGYNVAGNIQPKVDFYLKQGYDIRHIEQFPAAFSYSMDKRIKPRFAFLKQLNRTPVGVSLANILSPSDKTFSKRFGGDEHTYRNFLAEYATRAAA